MAWYCILTNDSLISFCIWLNLLLVVLSHTTILWLETIFSDVKKIIIILILVFLNIIMGRTDFSDKLKKTEDQWSCKRSPDILA